MKDLDWNTHLVNYAAAETRGQTRFLVQQPKKTRREKWEVGDEIMKILKMVVIEKNVQVFFLFTRIEIIYCALSYTSALLL